MKLFSMITKLAYLIACFLLQLPIAFSVEFCADKQLFFFSRETCPGGVLFKSPVELTEPCDCLNQQYLVAYSTCGLNSSVTNQSNSLEEVCQGLDRGRRKRKSDTVLVRLLQPAAINPKTDYANIRHTASKCKKILKKCSKLGTIISIPPNMTIGSSGPDKIHVSKFPNGIFIGNKTGGHSTSKNIHHHHHHHHHRQKRALSISNVLDEKVRERVQETMDLLNELQFGGYNVGKPKSMSFQLLEKTVEIYNHITPSVIADDEVINSILTLFFKKYADLELPGYSGRLTVDNQVDRNIFVNVMGSLQECESRAGESSQEYEFEATPDTCPPNITHIVYKVSSTEFGFKRFLYDLGNYMPTDRKYIPENEDFILGALWKVFDAVYSYCFSSVFSYRTSQTLNNYFTIISNIFTSPWTAKDYYADNHQGTLMYSSRIEHENLTILMRNLDYMTEAVHILSRYKPFFKKPVSQINPGKRPKRGWESKISIEQQTESKRESPIFSNRNKRSIGIDQSVGDESWAHLEIWDGRAYCLQTINPSLPVSIANSFPRVEDLCKS